MRKSMGDKVYLTYEQQIEKLKRDGLIVRRRAGGDRPSRNGKDIIISPSDIIGCSRTTKKRYIRGTRFRHIETLYNFDKHLRGIVYEYTQGVECNIKALIADTFSKRYGVNERSYLSEENFTSEGGRNGATSAGSYRRVRKFLKDSLERGRPRATATISRTTRRVYGHVPLWALIRALSFGNTSKFLKLMKADGPRGDRGGIRSRGQYFMQYDGNAGGVSEYRRSRRARILRAPSRRAAER